MRQSINPSSFWLTFFLCIISIILFSISIYLTNPNYLLTQLTIVSNYLNIIFIILILIIDISFYLLNSTKLENLNFIVRNKFQPMVVSYIMMTSLGYWIFSIIESVNKVALNSISLNNIYRVKTIYYHGLNLLILFIDMYINDHEYIKFNWVVYCYMVIYLFMYYIFLFIGKYALGINPYPFINNIKWIILVCSFSLVLIALTLSYFLYIFLIQLKYKDSNNVKESSVEQSIFNDYSDMNNLMININSTNELGEDSEKFL